MDHAPRHKENYDGAKVGKWIATDWNWDGIVKDYFHDGVWKFQIKTPTDSTMKYWGASNGNGGSGAKMEVA